MTLINETECDTYIQRFNCGHLPECGSECWDATKEGEADNDEK